MSVQIGQPAPDFRLLDQSRNWVALDDLKGKRTLLVFIPFPFTGVCTTELCELRDHMPDLPDTNVVAITTHAVPTNAAWADAQGVEYPVLSDYWPHGAVSRAYGTFNEKLGVAMRSTFVLDADGIARAVIATEGLGQAREYAEYEKALAAI